MFSQRALIALTLGPLALLVIYWGGWLYFLPMTAVLLLAAHEYNHLMQNLGLHTSRWVLLPLVFLLVLSGQWPHLLDEKSILFFALFITMAYALWLYERCLSDTVPMDWLAMLGGVLLIGWIGSHFLRLRGLEEMAWQWTMLAMMSNWAAEVGAYMIGRFLAGKFLLGRHVLSPRLSPNKTVEGYVGGALFGTAFTLIAAGYLGISLQLALILGLVASLLSPAGDLGISLLKREAGVKDTGFIFGEHGGALDRVDSLLWSVTFVYYLVVHFS